MQHYNFSTEIKRKKESTLNKLAIAFHGCCRKAEFKRPDVKFNYKLWCVI